MTRNTQRHCQKVKERPGSGGSCFSSQHLGDQWISKLKASLVYRTSSRTTRATQKNLISERKGKKEGRKRRGGEERRGEERRGEERRGEERRGEERRGEERRGDDHLQNQQGNHSPERLANQV